MASTLGIILSSINYSKEDIIANDTVTEKEYVPFIVNKSLSYFQDTILYVNEMNIHYNIPNKMQFLYLMKSVRKNKRFSKWMKQEKFDNLELIKEYYGYNNIKAKDALDILSPEQIQDIKERSYKGGTKKCK